MGFKERVSGVDPTIAMGLGGAAIGAIDNYLSDGASSELASDKADIKDWVNTDARQELHDKNTISDDLFTKIRDHTVNVETFPGVPVLGGVIDYITGRTEDISSPFSRTQDHRDAIEILKLQNPNARIEHGLTGTSIGGYDLDTTGILTHPSSDADLERYKISRELENLKLTPEEIRSQISQDDNLRSELASKESGLHNATRDSYLKNMGIGAAAGLAGGAFTNRYIKKR